MKAKMILNNPNTLGKLLSGKLKELEIKKNCRNAYLIKTKQMDHVRINNFKVVEIISTEVFERTKKDGYLMSMLRIFLGDIKNCPVLRRGTPRKELEFPKAYANFSFCYCGDPMCNFETGDEIKYNFSKKRIGKVYIYRNENWVMTLDSLEFKKHFRKEETK